MPAISLVVCIYREKLLLARLLEVARDCYDDLVVVHDGPDLDNVRELVERAGGRFFEHPRVGSLEGLSPFAWEQAAHDWILRLDADEFPSEEMKVWLLEFRTEPDPPDSISGFTCIWPLWDGRRTVSRRWPAGRIFLFHRQRVRFFGLVEQVPIPDGRYQPLELVLHHQPNRKSYGLANLLVRKQAHRWRALIAAGLQGKPTDLPTWRWTDATWPVAWETLRQRPFRTVLYRLLRGTMAALRDQWRRDRRFYPFAAISGPIHHTLFAWEYWKLRQRQRRKPSSGA